ncbi:MAG: beta-propeller domain-containing protein, partial [Firmicutes bacterium]|nr:beta-propeller domain-containing protein [Bacillota bacterium]
MLRKIITFFVTVVILALFLIPGLLLPQNSSTAAIGENSLVATLEEKPVAAEPCSIILYVGSPESIVNGKQIPIDSNPAVVPFIENSRTLMPLAFVARNMGFEVEWQEAKRTVLLNQQGLTLEFKLGSPIMINNGTAMEMETTARSYNDRTLAPISYVAKAMNLYVTYDRGLIILDSEKEYSLSADKEYIDSLISRLSGLPIVGSADKFNVLMKEIAEEQHDIVLYTEDVVAIETEAAGTDMPVPVPTMQPIVDNSVRESAQSNISKTDLFFGEGGDDIADYSTTNIQVAGVDEADIIKSDGNHIYHLTDNKFIITQADAKGNMKQLCVMDLQNKQAKWQDGFYPQEMYVADDRLCIIGTEHIYQEEEKYRFYGRSYVKALIYDISDKTNPQLIKEFSAEGDLQSSRKVDNILYLIVNYNMYFYGLDAPCDAVPLYRDSAASESELMPLNFGVMRYFPGSESNSILMICGLDIKDAQATANISSILGSGGAVYMSRSALYIAKYNYFYNIVPLDDKVNVDISDKTTFFKFVLDNGNAIYQGKGMALGTVLNQYSMDEFNGSFRAAMTINSGNGESKNALVVFDQSMQQIGSIDNMAPGERIYSARFMGERAFM